MNVAPFSKDGMYSVFVLIETAIRCLKIIDARLAKSTFIVVTVTVAVTVTLGFLVRVTRWPRVCERTVAYHTGSGLFTA